MRRPGYTILWVYGNSMAPGIPHRSDVYVDLTREAQNGEVARVVIRLGGKFGHTLKRVFFEDGLVHLVPDNKSACPILTYARIQIVRMDPVIKIVERGIPPMVDKFSEA